MPAIDTPFVMELRPGEELKLAQAPQNAATDDASAAAASTNAFSKNQFRAMVTGITFLEEVEEDGGSGESSGAAAATATSKSAHKRGAVRVTLLAHLQDSIEATAPALKAATLASCNFSHNPDTTPGSSSNNGTGVRNGGGGSAAATRKSRQSETADSSSAVSATVGSTVQFRAPLLFHSGGNVQALSVVAEDMATTVGSSGSSGSVKRYQGNRRFLVRLHGLQQTFLTQEQVVLLAQR